MRLSPILATGALLLGGMGCGGDDAPDTTSSSTGPVQASAEPKSPEEKAAQDAAIAYFLTTDPASCTEDATKNHIERDYGGSLRRCETVRRNNPLGPDHFAISGQEVAGNRATVRGQVLVTAEKFVIELVKIDGSWKIDRLRGSQ